MSMNNTQKNVASEIQRIAAELISIKSRLTTLSSMYANEGMGALVDADFAELAEFAHVTATEFQAAGGALVNVNTTLGDFSVGTNVSKLLRIVTAVPK